MNTSDRLVVCASHAPGMARDADQIEGRAFRGGLEQARRQVEKFAPELVVMFGVDHVRAYQPIVPAISVVLGATGRGDAGSPLGPYAVSREDAIRVTEHLLDANIDVAVTHEIELDHGFGQTMGDVVGGLDAVPSVPIYINCAEKPLMRLSRAAAVGRAVGAHFAGDPRRILFLATGGLSHAPATLVHGARGLSEEARRQLNIDGAEDARKAINPEWDRMFLNRIAETSTEWIDEVGATMEAEAGVGAGEVRSWLAAWAAGGTGLATLAYEPVLEWATGMGIVAG